MWQSEPLPNLYIVSAVLLLQSHGHLRALRVLQLHLLLPLPGQCAPERALGLPRLRIVRRVRLLQGDLLLWQAA